MLSLSSLKARWFSLLGSFVALVLAVVMLTMAGLLFTSAQPRMPQRFSAASIVVQSPDPQSAPDTFLPRRPWSPSQVERLVAELSAIPGVSAAIPDTPFYAQPVVDGKPGAATEGNSWAAAALAGDTLTAGSPPTREGEVVLPGHVPGGHVTILTAEGVRDYTVTGTAGALYFFKPFAGVRAIGLFTTGEVDLTRVSRVVAGQGRVLTGDARAALESPADARTRWIGMQVLTAMVALSTFVAVFLVASTFSFSVLQRTRELGLLRAIGATPKQLRRMMFGEAALISLVAGAIGIGLGCLGAPVVGSLLVSAGFEPSAFAVRYTAAPLTGAFLAGLAVALAGVFSAARRAASVRPLAALRAADAERRPMTRGRWIFGLLAVTLGGLLSYATVSADALSMPTLACGAVMAWVAGLALLSPALVPGLARILLAPFACGPLGLLVRQSATTSARRTAATAAPVMLAVAFTVLITGMVQTGAQAYTARRSAHLPGAAALIPSGTPGLTGAAVSSAGPAGVSILPTTVWHGKTPLPATGLPAAAFAELAPLAAAMRTVPAPSSPGPAPSALGEGTGPAPSALGEGGDDAIAQMIVARRLAEEQAWGAGSVVPLTAADGQRVEMLIAAVAEGMPAEIVLLREWVRAHDPDALTSVVYLPTAGGLVPAAGGKVITAAEYAAIADAEEDRLVWMFTLVLVGMAGGFTIIAVANTLLMAAIQRRPELHALGRLGATVRQRLRLVTLETTFVVAVGALLGLVTALAGLLAIRAGLSEQIGQQVPLVLAWPELIAVICACWASAVLVSAPTAR